MICFVSSLFIDVGKLSGKDNSSVETSGHASGLLKIGTSI